MKNSNVVILKNDKGLKPSAYYCKVCKNKYVKKKSLDNHNCKGYTPIRFTKSVDAPKKDMMESFMLYIKWCKRSGINIGNSMKTFEKFINTSDFMVLFQKMNGYTKRHGMNSDDYIRFVVKKHIPAMHWCTENYRHINDFYKFNKEEDDPVIQAIRTRTNIDIWISQGEDRNYDAFIDNLTPAILISLMKRYIIYTIPLMLCDEIRALFMKSSDIPDVFLESYKEMNITKYAEIADGLESETVAMIQDIIRNGHGNENDLEIGKISNIINR